jgi:hypothetical protein
VNKSHVLAVTVQRAATPSNRKVSPTQTQLEEQTMNKILTVLLIASALSSSAAFAEDRYRTSTENGKQRIDFSLNGNDKCVIINDRISCQPKPQAAVRVAASESN